MVLSWKVVPTDVNQELRNDGYNDTNVRYLVEERHVMGPRYLESRLSPWSVRHVSSKPHASLKAGLKSGHWYQFRVAAVNENGSRGYSAPSNPFKTTGNFINFARHNLRGASPVNGVFRSLISSVN